MIGESCRLCKKNKQLRNSHILPEFFYKNMYDEKHRALQVPSDAKRRMIEEENPGKFFDYGCLMITVPETRLIDKIIWSPTREKLFGHNGYRFFTGNLFWYFFVSSHAPDRSSQEYFLRESGLLKIWIAPWNEEEIITNIGSAFRSRKL